MSSLHSPGAFDQMVSWRLVVLGYVGLRRHRRILWIITQKKKKKTWTQTHKGLSCRFNSEKQLIRTLVRLSGFQSRHKVACETADSRCSCLMDRLAGPQLLSILSFANYCPRVARGSWAATENNRDNCNKGCKRGAVGPECLTATIMSACVCRLHKQPVQRLIVQRPSAFS